MLNGYSEAHGRRLEQLEGLGMSSVEQNKGVISTALNAVPGIGPVLSTVFNLAEGIFGGGDPTPLQHYRELIVQAQLQLAQMHHALGMVDAFTLPMGFTGTENETADLAILVMNDILRRVPSVHAVDTLAYDWGAPITSAAPWKQVWPAYQGSKERDYTMQALKSLAAQIGTAQLSLQNAGLAPPSQIPPPSSVPSASAEDSEGAGVVAPATAPTADQGAPGAAETPGTPSSPGAFLFLAAIVVGLVISSAR